MAKKKEISVEEKLRALYDLQLIDSKIDEIRNVRGELPLEVEDLEDEVAGLSRRKAHFTEQVEKLEANITNKQISIERSKDRIKKYEEQQKNVRNNREFDSLTKEVEYQELEIELSEKRIGEVSAKIVLKNATIEEIDEKITQKEKHLEHKRAELATILEETAKDEDALLAKSEEFGASIDDHLLKAYRRIRTKAKNGLAVVPIDRGASGGSYFTIPPQVQLEIANRKKITIDEHSGRILVDADLANEEKARMNSLFS